MARDDFYASAFGAVYTTYMEHPPLGRAVGRLVWGGDFRRYYESMAAIGEVPAAGTIVDCPCGAGPAFRGLSPGDGPRYVAADLSPSMLARARKQAAARGLGQVEVIAGDATALPLPDSSADLFLSFWGLHCYDDPSRALAEAARVLRPGARLVGATFVLGRDGLRQRFLIRPGQGPFGPIGTQPEIEVWLAQAGLEVSRLQRSGPFLFFEARRRSGGFAGPS